MPLGLGPCKCCKTPDAACVFCADGKAPGELLVTFHHAGGGTDFCNERLSVQYVLAFSQCAVIGFTSIIEWEYAGDDVRITYRITIPNLGSGNAVLSLYDPPGSSPPVLSYAAVGYVPTAPVDCFATRDLTAQAGPCVDSYPTATIEPVDDE